MKRKDYRKPEMTVIKLQHQGSILAGSKKSGDPMEDNTEINVIYDQEDI